MPAAMTSRQRLLAAARHEPVDRVPCSPRLGWGAKIVYPDSELSDVDSVLRAARPEELDFDPQFVTPSDAPNVLLRTDDDPCGLRDVKIGVAIEDDGDCERITRVFRTPSGALRETVRKPKPGYGEYGHAPNPIHVERLVKGPGDLEALRWLVPEIGSYDVGRSYRNTRARVGDLGLVMPVVSGALDYRAGYAYAMEDMMVDYFERRDFLDELIAVWRDGVMAETKALLERGADAIFASWFFTSLSVGWSPAMFRELFLPLIREHVALVHSYDALYDYYDDGRCMGIADTIAEAGVDIFETLTPAPVGDADLAELKRGIGDRVCLKGYGDIVYVLARGTPEDVDRSVREAMEVGAPGSGFIYGTSDNIRPETPRDNVLAYFAAAGKYGRECLKGTP